MNQSNRKEYLRQPVPLPVLPGGQCYPQITTQELIECFFKADPEVYAKAYAVATDGTVVML